MTIGKQNKPSVQGRSFVFNALFVTLNLLGLTMLVMGYHKNFENHFLLFSFIGYVLMALSIAGLFIFEGRLMMANVSRALMGGLFIVSGLVKANDPIGFSYKLEEYFEDGALAYRIKELFGAPGFSLEFLIDSALTLSVFICIAEIVLGVLIIIGGKIRLTSWLTVLMLLFFTFLTWHTADCDPSSKFVDRDTYSVTDPLAQMKIDAAKSDKTIKIVSRTNAQVIVEEMKQPQCVSDCGCFGDAMKGSVGRSLTPSESMWKDLVLLYFSLWLFAAQWIIRPNSSGQNIKFLVFSIVMVSALSWIFDWYFMIVFACLSIVGALWILRAGGYFLGNHYGSALIVAVFSGIFIGYVLLYEPLKDYRPYAVGKNLIYQMNDGKEGKYENTFVLKNLRTGKTESYSEEQYMSKEKLWDEKRYKFLKNDQEEIIPTKLPTITEQFNPFRDVRDLSFPENDLQAVREMLLDDPDLEEVSIRDYLVNADQIVVLTSKNLLKGDWSNIERYKTIYRGCRKEGIPFVMITNADKGQIWYFRKKNGFNVPVFLNDETELKAISRSNPSLMVIEKGVVTAKYPHRSTPTFDALKKNLLRK
ncbi:MAG: MauE/DoxX family redox-associated membrane protein [Flavobacteriia bacterium]